MPDAMDPMTLAMLSGGTQPGQADPLQVMRQYALAQKLQEMSLGGAQQPQQLGLEGTRYPHAARVGPAAALAPLVEAFMAQRGFKTAGPAMGAMMSRAYGLGPTDQSQTPQGPPTAQAGGSPSTPGPQALNPYAPVTQQDIAGAQVPGASPIQQIQSHTSLEGLKSYRELQLAAQKQQHTATIAQLDNLIKSDHPAQYAHSDQNFMTMWPHLAKQMGVDPDSAFNDQNVRRALGMIRNPLAASVGIPEEKIPEQVIPTTGEFGYRGQKDPVTGEEKQVQGREMPAKVGERYNPATGQMEAVYKSYFPSVDTSAPKTPSSAGTGGVSVTPVGYSAPTPENIKQVGFASTMHSGLQTVRSLENNGYSLTPAQRALLIQVATREDVGDIKQLAYQIGLKNLGGNAQAYLAGMMPIIQAVSHDQSGARLNSTQIRTNLESVIPVDLANHAAMKTINDTRDSFQNSMNLGSGSAAYTPEFNQSVGSMRRQAAAGAPQKTVTQANVQDYATKHRLTYAQALAHVQSNGYTVH